MKRAQAILSDIFMPHDNNSWGSGAFPGDILKNLVLGLPEGPEWGYGLDTHS